MQNVKQLPAAAGGLPPCEDTIITAQPRTCSRNFSETGKNSDTM